MSGRLRPVERYLEEEPQHRHRRVDGLSPEEVLRLLAAQTSASNSQDFFATMSV
jgi:hypothetical protein